MITLKDQRDQKEVLLIPVPELISNFSILNGSFPLLCFDVGNHISSNTPLPDGEYELLGEISGDYVFSFDPEMLVEKVGFYRDYTGNPNHALYILDTARESAISLMNASGAFMHNSEGDEPDYPLLHGTRTSDITTRNEMLKKHEAWQACEDRIVKKFVVIKRK